MKSKSQLELEFFLACRRIEYRACPEIWDAIHASAEWQEWWTTYYETDPLTTHGERALKARRLALQKTPAWQALEAKYRELYTIKP